MTGVPRERAAPRKAYRFPEAIEVGNRVLEILAERFPGHEWVAQAASGVELLVQRAIEQFAGTPMPTHTGPITQGSDYKAYARTAQEIKETMAAEEGAVTRAPKVVPRYRQSPQEIDIPDGDIADPMTPPVEPGKPKGWIL